MAFNFQRLLPNATKKKQQEVYDNVLYIILVEWGWSYEDFLNTPLVVIQNCLSIWLKANKKKKK